VSLRGPVGVVVPAAGAGRRMGGARKPFLELHGDPVLRLALDPFLEHPRVIAVRVALPRGELGSAPGWLRDLDPRVELVEGGETRAESVRAGVEALPPEVRVVLVHDGARPLLDRELVDRCLEAVGPRQGAVVGMPVADTLKEVDAAGRVVGTPERRRFWRAQTPQGFPADLLREAYTGDLGSATDDASLVERLGAAVVMVQGSPENVKVTLPGDVELATFLLEGRRAAVAALALPEPGKEGGR